MEHGPASSAEPRRNGFESVLARIRGPRVAWPVLAAAPLPLALALAVTARPVYPDDACFYGAPQASIDATDRYLALMSPLALFAMAAVALVALPVRGYWRPLAPAVAVLAAVSLAVPDVARPVMVFGGNVAVFGALLALVVLIVIAVVAKETSWVLATGWFEFLILLPVLLGVAGLIAQPGCYDGDPPAPVTGS